jgi:DMSO reductase anchor subunit
MNPAASVIFFTVFSGLGFGLLALLGLGFARTHGLQAFGYWALAYGFAVVGLLASTAHLGNPQRAWRALSQWKSSWLSREGICAVATLLVLAPVALSDMLGLLTPHFLGLLGAALAVGTVLTTAMIYAQLKTVPRWNHVGVPVSFFNFMLTGGLLVFGAASFALMALGLLAVVLIWGFWFGVKQFPARAQSIATATGLGQMGDLRLFEAGHTAENYLMREMIYVVGRKHSAKLRVLAVFFSCVIPALFLYLIADGLVLRGVALGAHLIGVFVARWLFFAEAEHVVGLYYDKR